MQSQGQNIAFVESAPRQLAGLSSSAAIVDGTGGGGAEAAGGSVSPEAAEDRLQQVRQNATGYIDRFDLRHVIQEMFQSVIKESPSNPFEFMQAFLRDGPGKSFRPEVTALPSTQSGAPAATSPGNSGGGGDDSAGTPVLPNAASQVEADAEEELKRGQQMQQYEGQVSEQQGTITLLRQQLEDLMTASERAAANASSEQAKIETLEGRIKELDTAALRQAPAADEPAERAEMQGRFEQQAEEQRTQIQLLESRIKELDTASLRQVPAADENVERAEMQGRFEKQVEEQWTHIQLLDSRIKELDAAALRQVPAADENVE